MNLRDFLTKQQQRVDPEVITFDYSVRPDEGLDDVIVVAGGFSPFAEEDNEPFIVIELILSKDIDEFEDDWAEFDYLIPEIQIVVNHELIHYEQWQAGKFKFDEDDRLINREELEEEAYALEEKRGYIL